MIEKNNTERPLTEGIEVLHFDRSQGLLGLMDCGGSNLKKINEQMPGIVRIIGTTRIHHKEVRARDRAFEMGVPLVEVDFAQYEVEHGVTAGDYFKALRPDLHGKITSGKTPSEIIQVRNDVCSIFLEKLYSTMDREGISRNIPVFAAGCMAILSPEFVNSFYVVNVHPADLTIYGNDRKRLLTGDAWRPSARAIKLGHHQLYSSTHAMIPGLDEGPLHMRGYSLPVPPLSTLLDGTLLDTSQEKVFYEEVGRAAQESLKVIGDHVIAGATFWDLFDGLWARHVGGLAYKFKEEWKNVPSGILIQDHIMNSTGSPFGLDEKTVLKEREKFHAELTTILQKYDAGKLTEKLHIDE